MSRHRPGDLLVETAPLSAIAHCGVCGPLAVHVANGTIPYLGSYPFDVP